MIIIFLLSMICDISLYMMFANLAVNALFESAVAMFAPLIAMPLTAACAYLLHNIRPRLRFLSLLLLPLCFYPVRSLTSALILLVPCIYVAVVVFFMRFHFDAEPLRERIKVCAVIISLPLAAVIFRGYDYLASSYYFQHILIYMCCALCIFRMTRVNSAVLTPRFIVINLAPVVGGFVALAVLSSMRVLTAILQGLGFIFTHLVVPLIKLFISAFGWIRAKVGYSAVVGPNVDDPINAAREGVSEMGGALEATPLPPVIQWLIVILLIALVIFAVRKLLIGRRRKYAASNAFESREAGTAVYVETPSTGKLEFFTPRDSRMAVRHHYRRFLRMCAEKGCPPKKGDTSKDINIQNKKSFAFESMARLRELYIKARYSEHVVRSNESKEAGELVKRLRDNNLDT